MLTIPACHKGWLADRGLVPGWGVYTSNKVLFGYSFRFVCFNSLTHNKKLFQVSNKYLQLWPQHVPDIYILEQENRFRNFTISSNCFFITLSFQNKGNNVASNTINNTANGCKLNNISNTDGNKMYKPNTKSPFKIYADKHDDKENIPYRDQLSKWNCS